MRSKSPGLLMYGNSRVFVLSIFVVQARPGDMPCFLGGQCCAPPCNARLSTAEPPHRNLRSRYGENLVRARGDCFPRQSDVAIAWHSMFAYWIDLNDITKTALGINFATAEAAGSERIIRTWYLCQ